MSTFSTPAVSEAGKAVALAVVIALAAAFLPLVSLPLMAFMPLPLAFVVLRRGIAVGVAASFCTAALTLALAGPGNGLLALCLSGVVGIALGLALRRDWNFSVTLLTSSAVAALSLGTLAVVVWTVTGLSREQLQRSMDQSLQAAKELYASLGVTQATLDALSQQFQALLRVLPYMLPSVFAIAGLLLVAASLALAGSIFPRAGQAVSSNLSFARFRLHWGLAYGFIAGLVLLVVSPSLSSGAEAARLIGLNLLLIFQTLYFLQGLALVHSFSVSRRLGGGGRALLYGGAVVGQLMLWMLSWVGLLDTWFDYRKRFAPREPAPSAPPAGDEDGGDSEEW